MKPSSLFFELNFHGLGAWEGGQALRPFLRFDPVHFPAQGQPGGLRVTTSAGLLLVRTLRTPNRCAAVQMHRTQGIAEGVVWPCASLSAGGGLATGVDHVLRDS